MLLPENAQRSIMRTYLLDLPDQTLKIRGVLLSEEPAIAAGKHQPQDLGSPTFFFGEAGASQQIAVGAGPAAGLAGDETDGQLWSAPLAPRTERKLLRGRKLVRVGREHLTVCQK